MKLKCRLGYHKWTNWTEPKIEKAKGDFWEYKKYVQTRQCTGCNKKVIRDL